MTAASIGKKDFPLTYKIRQSIQLSKTKASAASQASQASKEQGIPNNPQLSKYFGSVYSAFCGQKVKNAYANLFHNFLRKSPQSTLFSQDEDEHNLMISKINSNKLLRVNFEQRKLDIGKEVLKSKKFLNQIKKSAKRLKKEFKANYKEDFQQLKAKMISKKDFSYEGKILAKDGKVISNWKLNKAVTKELELACREKLLEEFVTNEALDELKTQFVAESMNKQKINSIMQEAIKHQLKESPNPTQKAHDISLKIEDNIENSSGITKKDKALLRDPHIWTAFFEENLEQVLAEEQVLLTQTATTIRGIVVMLSTKQDGDGYLYKEIRNLIKEGHIESLAEFKDKYGNHCSDIIYAKITNKSKDKNEHNLLKDNSLFSEEAIEMLKDEDKAKVFIKQALEDVLPSIFKSINKDSKQLKSNLSNIIKKVTDLTKEERSELQQFTKNLSLAQAIELYDRSQEDSPEASIIKVLIKKIAA